MALHLTVRSKNPLAAPKRARKRKTIDFKTGKEVPPLKGLLTGSEVSKNVGNPDQY